MADAQAPFSKRKGEGTGEEQEEKRLRYETAREQLWSPATELQQQQTLAAQQYGLEAQRMGTAAQQQLGAGIEQARADLMAGAGARGVNPALGRAAGYAGAALGQRGVGMAAGLQARELAAAQAMRQQALEQQAALQMQMAEQALGAQAAESQAYQAYQALAAQQAAAQQQQTAGYIGAGLGAGGAALGMLGGLYSDRQLKGGVKRPLTAQEAELLNALRAEGARTEGALDAATGRAMGSQQATDARVEQLTQQLQAEGARTEQRLGVPVAAPRGPATAPPSAQQQTLSSLSGAGRQYQYTPQAQQQLGQPPGVQYGPMAQDLAKTELGRSAVVPTPAGLAVDTGRLSMIQSGLIGQQEERLRRIEEQLQAEGARTEARLRRATR